MPWTITVTEARSCLPELLDRVLGGEEITLTRHGRPVAVLVRPDLLRHRRATTAISAAHRLHEELRSARDRPLPPEGTLPSATADALAAGVLNGRR